MKDKPTRRGLAAATAGTLAAGTVAGVALGTAAPAAAGVVDVPHEFKATCSVVLGDLDLGDYTINFDLNTKAEVPLVPGATNPKQAVDITLTMPKKLHKAVKVLKVNRAKGHSPNSAVVVKMPIIGGKHVRQRIEIRDLKAPKSRVPGLKKQWKITSHGFVPKIHVPGFAGNGSTTLPPSSFAELRLAPRFRIKSTLFAKTGKRYKAIMKCKVRKADRVVKPQVPIFGAYVTDTISRHVKTPFGEAADIKLAFFHKPGATVPADGNTWTQPSHGTLTPGAQGVFTYTPDQGYAGKDSFTYTAKDSTGESTSKVRIRVRKAPTNLRVRAPKRIRFGQRANVRVRVKTDGAAKGKVRLMKGKRVLDKAKVRGGSAKLHVKRKALEVGKHKLRVKYSGSDNAKKETERFTLRVRKARTNLEVRAPKSIRFGKRANVRVRVKTAGAAKGKVRLFKGKRLLDKARVRDGGAKLHIKREALKVGKHKLRVKYAGSKSAQKARATFRLRVKPRR